MSVPAGHLLALGSAALYGAADFVGGITARRAGTIPVVVISQAAGLGLLAVLIPLLPGTSPSRADLLWGAGAGLTGGVGVALLYRALAIGTMAVVAPTTAVCAVAIPVLIAMLLGERLGPVALAGIGLAILSIVLVSQTRPISRPREGSVRGASWPPGLGTALCAGVVIGFFFLSLAQCSAQAGMWPLVAARAVSVTIFAGIALVGGLTLRLQVPVAALAVAGGAVDMLANALYLLATRSGPLSLVVTLSSLYPASTVLLARLILGERLNPLQLTGVLCALSAVVLIVRGSP